MPKLPLFFVALIVIIASATVTYTLKPKSDGIYRAGDWPEGDRAVNQAQHFFSLRRAAGEKFEGGQCLSDALMTDWVAYIGNVNTCPAFLRGGARHFVELNGVGEVVRVK